MPTTVVAPDQPARRAVIVVQEAFGVDDHIVDVCERFAALGYLAVAPHLFHRDGVTALPHDLEAVKPFMNNLTADGILADVNEARNYATSQGFSTQQVGIIGFCMGGSVALFSAVNLNFGAAVTFYGGGVAAGRFGFPPLLDIAADVSCPWLGLYGDLDPTIPVEQVEALRDAAAHSSAPTSVVRYAAAGHAFHCDTRPDRYHEPSARDAWQKAIDWFDRYLDQRPAHAH
jgi:carboxymethylenebutenolidase